VCCIDALKPSELIDRMELRRTLTGRNWHVQATRANTADGVYEAMDSLARLVTEFRSARPHYMH